MLARSIARRTSSLTSSNGVVTRSFNKSQVSRFAAGGHGDKHGDAHGDGHGHGHDHHPHPMWSSLPFDKRTTGILCSVILFGGIGVVTTAVVHQNVKHGFWK